MAWLTKRNEASLAKCGLYPGARPLEDHIRNGIIVIDKPSGPTSNQIDGWVKEILGIEKCSHAGTLDPRATGVLAIALQNATKLMPILLSSKKEYVGILHLHEDVERKKVEKVFASMIGKVRQLPPLKSAVARKEREREIYYLDLLEVKGRDVLFRVGCEAGFYVRRLAVDVGKELGIKSHLQELRRTKSGSFNEEDAITLQQLMDAVADDRTRDVVLPMEVAMENVGKIVVSDTSISSLCNGSPLFSGGIVRAESTVKKDDWVALFSLKGELVAIGKSLMDAKQAVKKKGMVVKVDRVLMDREEYPKP